VPPFPVFTSDLGNEPRARTRLPVRVRPESDDSVASWLGRLSGQIGPND